MATFENEFGYEDIKKEIESYKTKPAKKKIETCALCSAVVKTARKLDDMIVCEDCYDMENEEVFTE